MTVEKIISTYNTSKDKESFFEKHIKTKYIPYEEKMVRCQSIIDASMFTTVENKKIFKQNSPLQYVLFCVTLINCYTDIEVIMGDGMLKQFNILNENGLINKIIMSIPESEYDEFNTILHMFIDDLIINERNIVSYIDGKIDSLSLLLNSLPPIDELVKTE